VNCRLQTIHHKYPNGSTVSKFDDTYDAVGNILTWRQQADADAVLWEYGYDPADQLTAAVKQSTDPTPVVLKRYAYAYDPAGNRTVEQIDDQPVGATYDNLNRLMSQQPAGAMVVAGTVNEPATVTVQSKAAPVTSDNRFTTTTPVVQGTNTLTITAADPSGNTAMRQYEVDSAGAGRTFTYDANGNLTSDGAHTFEWDARNQLGAINVGTLRSEFTYDGSQRRVQIVERDNGVVRSDTKLIWCETTICEERAADGVFVGRRLFVNGEQVSGLSRFFARDHLASVTDVTNVSAGLTSHYAFDAWGRRTVTVGSDVTEVGFTGHSWDETAALWLSHYRGYDPSIGRWISEDPAGIIDGPNLFAYVNNDPTGLFDIDGLSAGISMQCGPCRIRIQTDPVKGKHAHWRCHNGSSGCIKIDGTPCDNSGPPPNRVRDCLNKKRFFEREEPACGSNCQKVVLVVVVLDWIVEVCLTKVPIPAPW
jgi:RHS repeat-associated protein